MAKITFYGGVGTVTGSKYLLEHNGKKILVDCGLFQGLKELRERNWQDPPFAPDEIDAVIITHAHIDHTGWLPRLVKLGFKGEITTSRATGDLLKILLPGFRPPSGRRSRLSQPARTDEPHARLAAI